MTRTGWANAGALATALGLTVAAAWDGDRGSAPGASAASNRRATAATLRVPAPGGGQGIADSTGHVVPLRHYQRIVSTSTLTDRLLVELSEPERVLAFSASGTRTAPWAHQMSGKPAIDGLGPLETIIALKPDLVLMNSFGAIGRVAKLRAAGIEVFDLGELRGLSTLLPMSEVLAELLGAPERGTRFRDTFERRMRNVAARLGSAPRRSAVYVAVIGSRLYGGTRGTSYHDVITNAGLTDAAAARFREWPQYSAEQLLELAPDVIVTKEGMSEALCRYPGMDRLPPCRTPGALIELPPALLDEPGPGMLDATEALFARAYPDR